MNEQEKIHREKLVKTLKHLENYALMLTHDRDRANDLLQETSLKIMNNYQNYHEDGFFTPWAKTVMRNTFLNEVKIISKNSDRIVDGYDFYHDENVHPFVAESEVPYTVNEIRRAMKELPIQQYNILKMRENGYKYEEIARVLDISIGSVKSKIFAAKVNLRNIMNNLQ